jgi:hypothetical protein
MYNYLRLLMLDIHFRSLLIGYCCEVFDLDCGIGLRGTSPASAWTRRRRKREKEHRRSHSVVIADRPPSRAESLCPLRRLRHDLVFNAAHHQ